MTTNQPVNVLTVGQLIKKDLKKAYFFPTFGSSYCKNFRFLNKNKYRIYDYPPKHLTHVEVFCPQENFCTAGNEIPVLTDHPPPEFLQQHWTKWLPVFPLANYINIDDGLKDPNIPIVTCFAFEGIPKNKHSFDPNVLYNLQLKSTIPKIGVPCPRYMDENNVEFPCVVKADLSFCGFGTRSAYNRDELSALVQEMRENHGWRDKIIYQELLREVKQVLCSIFYLQKSGEVVWLGTNLGLFRGFEWEGLIYDWDKQDEERNLVYDDFVVPIKDYLHKHGYFGFVEFEVVVTNQGRYLVDLNVRLGGQTQHFLMAPYMASMDFNHSISKPINPIYKTSAKQLVDNANQLNERESGRGRIVVLSVADVDDGECENMLSIFGKTRDDVEKLLQKIQNFPVLA